jgi:hypothetical protein
MKNCVDSHRIQWLAICEHNKYELVFLDLEAKISRVLLITWVWGRLARCQANHIIGRSVLILTIILPSYRDAVAPLINVTVHSQQ